MTIDRNALASDLESLGLKATAGAVRNGSLAPRRALATVQSKRNRWLEAGNGRMRSAAQEVLDRYRGEAS